MSDSSSSPLQLLVTARMRTAFLQCKQLLRESDRTPDYRELQQIFAANNNQNEAQQTPALITIPQLRNLSRLYRSTLSHLPNNNNTSAPAPVSEKDLDADENLVGEGWMHELLRGSRPYVAPPVRRKRDPAFLRYLEEMRIKQEKRDYRELVKDLKGQPSADPEDNVVDRDNYKSASRDIGHGLNILTLMGTGFAVFYYAGTGLFPHNPVFQVMCGLLGLVGALLVEVGLFLAREQKAELETTNHRRMAKVAKEKALRAHQLKEEETQKELERRYQRVVLQKNTGNEEEETKLLGDESKLD